MIKTIKHKNIMKYMDKRDKSFEFICRGCSMRNRHYIWESFVGSISDWLNRQINNSYLTFEEEPDNDYDPNAIMIVCRGEHFGTCGYVGKEYTLRIKEILKNCYKYRIDMVDETEVGNKEIRLIVSWIENDKVPEVEGLKVEEQITEAVIIESTSVVDESSVIEEIPVVDEPVVINENVEIKKNKGGRPKGNNRVHGIRCSDAEYIYLKECLKRYREKKVLKK